MVSPSWPRPGLVEPYADDITRSTEPALSEAEGLSVTRGVFALTHDKFPQSATLNYWFQIPA